MLDSIGHRAATTEHYALAYCVLKRLDAIDPKRKGIAYDLAIASMETGHFAESTRYFARAEAEAAADGTRDQWLQAAWMDGYGRVAFGDTAGARVMIARMKAVDSMHAGVAGVESYLAHFARRFDEARRPMLDRLSRGVRPPSSYAHIGDAFLAEGMVDSARVAFERALALDTAASLGLTGHAVSTSLAAVALAQGRRDEAAGLLRRSETRVRRALADGRDSQVYPYDMAAIFALRGDTASALTWLSRAIDQGWRKVAFTRFDPLLTSLHGSRGFERLLARDDSLSAAERRAARARR
jgi:tetratricopeptide (TPR) repeat protein